MKVIKVEQGLYRTENERFTIKASYTSADGGRRLERCYKVYDWNHLMKTCKTLKEAKSVIELYA